MRNKPICLSRIGPIDTRQIVPKLGLMGGTDLALGPCRARDGVAGTHDGAADGNVGEAI